jgi:hypothetical protein
MLQSFTIAPKYRQLLRQPLVCGLSKSFVPMALASFGGIQNEIKPRASGAHYY